MVQQIGTGAEALNPMLMMLMQMQKDRAERQSRTDEMAMRERIENKKLQYQRDLYGLDKKKGKEAPPKAEAVQPGQSSQPDPYGYTTGGEEVSSGFKDYGVPGAIAGGVKALGQNLSKGLGLTDLGAEWGRQAEESRFMDKEIEGKTAVNKPLQSIKGALKKRGSALAPDIAFNMIKAGIPQEQAVALVQQAVDELGKVGNVASGVEYLMKQRQVQQDDF